MKKPVLVVLALLVVSAVSSRAIITRHDVGDDKYKWEGRKYNRYLSNLTYPGCEGALIAPQWVLTAAHCAELLEKHTYIQIGQRPWPMDTVIVHPDRKDGVDLALVHLSDATARTQTVYVYRGSDELGMEAVIAGHGYHATGRGDSLSLDFQVRGATNVVDEVNDRWIVFTFDEPGSKNTTELEGVGGPMDTGGPALVEIDSLVYTIGVNAWQKNTAIGLMPGRYGVKAYYLRVSKYADWIESVLAKWGDKLPVAEAGADSH